MNPKIIQADLHNLNELISGVGELHAEFEWRCWFRGHEDLDWPLLPSVRRDFNREQERYLSNEFYMRARTRHHKCPADDDWAGWLSLMQHYGLPTRLLDWSNSPLVAAFFATQRATRHWKGAPPVDACIWVFAPGEYNKMMGFEPYLYPLNAGRLTKVLRPAIKGSDNTKSIMAAWAVESDPRMQVQQGAFTIHASELPLDEIVGCEKWLRKFKIPGNSVPVFARELEDMGVRLADLFPDLGNLATELKARHKTKSFSLSFKTGSPCGDESKPKQMAGGSKPSVFLCQNHKSDKAVTIKEDCSSRGNLAWICRGHGQLDFKCKGAKGTTRYLIAEIAYAGGDVVKHPDYSPSPNGATCHQGGGGFQGGIRFGSVAKAVQYLKQYFNLVACAGNRDETQIWIDHQ